MPDRKHGNFAKRWGHLGNGRLEYGLDYIKAMPKEWSDEKRWAMMVELYDELRDERDDLAARFEEMMDPAKWESWLEHVAARESGVEAMINALLATPLGQNAIKVAEVAIQAAEHLNEVRERD